MHEFLVLASVAVLSALFCAAVPTDPVIIPEGCMRLTSANGNSAIICNGTSGTPGPPGPAPTLINNGTVGCCQPKCEGARGTQGPVGIPGATGHQEPVRDATPAPVIPSRRSIFSYLWSPIEAVLNGIYNTVTEVIMRAIAYSISRIIDMVVVAAMAYGISKFVAKAKGGWLTATAAPKAEPPIVPAFPGTGYSLVA